MSIPRLLASLGLFVCSAPLPARAELPSLVADARTAEADRAERGARSARELVDYAGFGQRSVRMQALGSLDYRFAGKGLKASVAYRGVAVNTLLGYSGKHRFEFDWRSHGSDFKLAFSVDSSNGGYRLEFVHGF